MCSSASIDELIERFSNVDVGIKRVLVAGSVSEPDKEVQRHYV